jgi:hypothetical protein
MQEFLFSAFKVSYCPNFDRKKTTFRLRATSKNLLLFKKKENHLLGRYFLCQTTECSP